MELLLRDSANATPSDLAERLNFVVEGARKMDRVVEGLAAYTVALQTNPGSFLPVRTDVLLRAALAKLAKPLKDNAAEVTYGDLPRVSGDSDRLIQLFENLIRNCLEHRGSAPPQVRVTGTENQGVWLFAVQDNGPGVEEGDLERIFQPFEKLHGTGAGLGLATCRAIVQAHGGTIWAESGHGLTVRFTLPVWLE